MAKAVHLFPIHDFSFFFSLSFLFTPAPLYRLHLTGLSALFQMLPCNEVEFVVLIAVPGGSIRPNVDAEAQDSRAALG